VKKGSEPITSYKPTYEDHLHSFNTGSYVSVSQMNDGSVKHSLAHSSKETAIRVRKNIDAFLFIRSELKSNTLEMRTNCLVKEALSTKRIIK
jgi:hypothetical protein